MTRRRQWRPPECSLFPEETRVIIGDTELQRMSFKECLEWASGRDGRLDRKRLTRIALARNYSPGWVHRLWGRDWKEVYAETEAWNERGRDKWRKELARNR
jgi:hypothetical protein